MKPSTVPFLVSALALSCFAACRPTEPPSTASNHGHGHVHVAPHGGTAVVLGRELYHLELVLDAAAGRLTAYVLDGHMENFIRLTNEVLTFQIEGVPQPLVLQAQASQATGEKVGDTSTFRAESDWLRTRTNFTGLIERLPIRGTTFTNVGFRFPEGNENSAGH